MNRRKRNESNLLPLDLITPEGYLDRVYIGDETYTQVGQNAIFEDLITKYVAAPQGGIPIRVVNLDGDPGTLRDRIDYYHDKDDKTIYSVFVDFMGIEGGPEWTIGLEWVDDTHIGLVLYVGSRVGASPIPGLQPAATFDLPGCVKTFEVTEDYSSGAGANDVMAVSSGQGDTRPQSPHQTFADPDRPRAEYRWTPSTSITDVDTLTDHAMRALAAMQNGSTAIALTGNLDTSPALGVDWNLGDDVTYDVTSAAFPDRLEGVARVGGWERTLTGTKTATPILVVDGDLDA